MAIPTPETTPHIKQFEDTLEALKRYIFAQQKPRIILCLAIPLGITFQIPIFSIILGLFLVAYIAGIYYRCYVAYENLAIVSKHPNLIASLPSAKAQVIFFVLTFCAIPVLGWLIPLLLYRSIEEVIGYMIIVVVIASIMFYFSIAMNANIYPHWCQFLRNFFGRFIATNVHAEIIVRESEKLDRETQSLRIPLMNLISAINNYPTEQMIFGHILEFVFEYKRIKNRSLEDPEDHEWLQQMERIQINNPHPVSNGRIIPPNSAPMNSNIIFPIKLRCPRCGMPFSDKTTNYCRRCGYMD